MPVRVSKAKLWQAIRKNCIECFGGQMMSVKDCSSPKCQLFPYRMGKPDIFTTADDETSQETQMGPQTKAKKPAFWNKVGVR